MLPEIGAYGVWSVRGGQVEGKIVEHLGGNRFLIETEEGIQEYEFPSRWRPRRSGESERTSSAG